MDSNIFINVLFHIVSNIFVGKYNALIVIFTMNNSQFQGLV